MNNELNQLHQISIEQKLRSMSGTKIQQKHKSSFWLVHVEYSLLDAKQHL